MLEKFTSMFANIRKSEKGFTLIELMIVVAIIGILAAIAIPQFASYREKAYDAAAKADLSNLATALENYFLDNTTYTTTTAGLTGFQTSSNVSVTVTGTSISSFEATAKHSASTNTFTYISTAGGIQ